MAALLLSFRFLMSAFRSGDISLTDGFKELIPNRSAPTWHSTAVIVQRVSRATAGFYASPNYAVWPLSTNL